MSELRDNLSPEGKAALQNGLFIKHIFDTYFSPFHPPKKQEEVRVGTLMYSDFEKECRNE